MDSGHHFATWIHSLDHTSVANSVCLVTTSSLWTGLIALIFLRKKSSSPLFWISCLLGILGVGILTGYKKPEKMESISGETEWPNRCGLYGGLSASRPRSEGSNLFSSFLLLCYGSSVAFLWLFLWLVQSGPPSVQSSDWIFLIALAIVSQVMGHGIYNWCIRWMDARMVALSLLGEPVGATFLAWMFLHESIGLQQLTGMIILLIALSLPSVQHLQSTKTSIP